MAYAIEHDETTGAAIARIVREQIARAREQLTDRKAPVEKRVHDARKRFKEIRAVLRLAREPFGAQFDVENAWYRDAGHTLAGARDADAVLEALEKLAKITPLPGATLRRTRRLLKKRRPSAHELSAHIDGALALLQTALDRVDSWPPLAAIAARPRELAREAGTMGPRVYGNGRRQWLARRSNYWSTWRGN